MMFHLSIKPQIVFESIPQNVLLRWKIVLFGLDKNDEKYVNSLGLPEDDSHPALPSEQNNLTLAHHNCFDQIDKDLHRTFNLPEQKRKMFENVLKRIANHFPKTGYTQGMNFIIGYLILIGYS